MGRAEPSEVVTNDGRELAKVLPALEDGFAGLSHSRNAMRVTSGVAIWLALGPLISPVLFGEAMVIQSALFMGAAWSVFALATWAFHVLGARSSAYRIAAVLDGFAQYAALLALIHASGNVASPLWALLLVKSYAWTPQLRGALTWGVVQIVSTHFVFGLLYALAGSEAAGLFVWSAALGMSSAQITTGRATSEMLRLRADVIILGRHVEAEQMSHETERVARELHDGVSADITALILHLRRAARIHEDDAMSILADRAEGLLAKTREVIRTLHAP